MLREIFFGRENCQENFFVAENKTWKHFKASNDEGENCLDIAWGFKTSKRAMDSVETDENSIIRLTL